MKSLFAPARTVGAVDRVDHAVQLLEDEWRRRSEVPLNRWWNERKRLLESESVPSVVLLAELVRTDLRCRFARGENPAVVTYLEQFPELNAADTRVLSLIYEEFCLAEEREGRVDVDAFCARYPRWKESLVSQLQYHHLLSQAAGVRSKALPPFPEVGQTFEEFQLLAMLGRGGISRVFLARDLSLGGKQVVLKVSLDRGREPQAQGPLEHPHIVPVNSVVFGPDGMRGLSMPYRPGLPLDEVIRRIEPATHPRKASTIWRAIVETLSAARISERAPGSEIDSSTIPATPAGDGWQGFPILGTYAEGAAWIVRVIAEALDYAHRHQTFHRDVKPGNILITPKHGPQLFDFNLADSPHTATQAQAAMNGGTLPYMAPEQIEAFLNPDLWGKVGAQADVYALGLVLRELLTGQAPDLPAETLAPARAMRVLLDRRPLLDLAVRRMNPNIPHALGAIVAKCLAIPLEERYATAGALAEDLERFLQRRPLLHARNRCWRERCANWGVRHRVRLALGAVCLASALALADTARPNRPIRPLPPIQSSPEFMTAVSALDGGTERNAGSINLLIRLSDSYPGTGLPRLYLGLAYEARDFPVRAENELDAARKHSNLQSELLDWSSRDPRLSKRLEDFANLRLNLVVETQHADDRSSASDPQIQRHKYRLVVWALETAKILRDRESPPESGKNLGAPPSPEKLPGKGSIEFRLARAEQEAGEYEKVIQLADDALEELIAVSKNDPTDGLGLLEPIYEWRMLLSRAHTKLAQELRQGGEKDHLEAALKHLDDADRMLYLCSYFKRNAERNTPDLQRIARIRLASALVRVEVLLDRHNIHHAQSTLHRAREFFKKYNNLSGTTGQTRDLDSWWKRLRALEGKVRQETPRSEATVVRGPSHRQP